MNGWDASSPGVCGGLDFNLKDESNLSGILLIALLWAVGKLLGPAGMVVAGCGSSSCRRPRPHQARYIWHFTCPPGGRLRGSLHSGTGPVLGHCRPVCTCPHQNQGSAFEVSSLQAVSWTWVGLSLQSCPQAQCLGSGTIERFPKTLSIAGSSCWGRGGPSEAWSPRWS